MLYRSSLEDYTVLMISYSEEVVNQSEDVEKCVKKGAAHHTSKVLANEPEEGSRAL